jgi:hypothetical protein
MQTKGTVTIVNKRQKQTKVSKKEHQKHQNTLKKFLEIYEDQRPIKTIKISLSFLVIIFNRSDE